MDSKELDMFYSELKKELNKDDDLSMPNTSNKILDVHEILDNTNPKDIYLSSDWHYFKNHYKKEHNYVNTQKITTWSRQNIKEDNVFMYLGDISFRYANEEDQKESQRLLASIPGIKVLILGNHDKMLGQDYFTGCGFDFVFDRLIHNGILYTHEPENIEVNPEVYLNIHGHIHNIKEYNTTDGKNNINVYPLWYDNKPVTLDYCLKHKDKLVADNKRSDWTQIGENADYRDIEDLDINLEALRSNLKDNQFGIPEDRKFPLDSEKHVMSAIKLFGHAEESKKKALAKRIQIAAKRYDIKIPETTQVYKYLAESVYDDVTTIDIPSEVKNIVFDMGSVLVDDDGVETYKSNPNIPDEYCEEIYEFIGKELFCTDNPYIKKCNIENAKEYIKSKAPSHIIPYIDEIFESISKGLYKLNYVDDLINTFKSRGYKVFYLSNWEKCLYELESDFFEPLIEKFDGGLFSYECQIEKPSLSIYTLFTDKFNLNPNECLFFDDKQENIDAAKLCGWHGIVFNKEITYLQIFKTLDYMCNIVALKMNEWSMAAMNPIVGITKPYVLKMHNDCGSLINANQYALATDLVSDKYLVINENANLEIVDASNLNNMLIEEYEFVGDMRLLKKIEEAYYSKKTVDNTFFYTALTGKPMLSEDQIDFDPNFKKVDFVAMKEQSLTQLATLNELFLESMNKPSMKVNVMPNKYINNLLEGRTHISIMKDLDGFYAYNTEKNIRSASVEEQEFLTEQIVQSVL